MQIFNLLFNIYRMQENTENQNKIAPEQALAVVVSLVRATKLTYDETTYADNCVKVLTDLVQNSKPTIFKP